MSDVIVWLSQAQWKRLREEMQPRVPAVFWTRFGFRLNPPKHAARGDRVFVVAHNRIQGYSIIEEIVTTDRGIARYEYQAADKKRKMRRQGRKIMRRHMRLRHTLPAIVFLCRRKWIPCTEWVRELRKPKRYAPFMGYHYPRYIDDRLVSFPFQDTAEAQALAKERKRFYRAYLSTRRYTRVLARLMTPSQRELLSWGKGEYIPWLFPTHDGTVIALLKKGTYDVGSVRNAISVRGAPTLNTGWHNPRDAGWQVRRRANP